jgi:hypothetical protein
MFFLVLGTVATIDDSTHISVASARAAARRSCRWRRSSHIERLVVAR